MCRHTWRGPQRKERVQQEQMGVPPAPTRTHMPALTSVAITHSSFSEMTNTDWYLVSFDRE